MAGATARKDARYTAELVVTAERRPQPLREVGRRMRAAARSTALRSRGVVGGADAESGAGRPRAALRGARSGRTVRHFRCPVIVLLLQ